MPGSCMSRVHVRVRARVRSPSTQHKRSAEENFELYNETNVLSLNSYFPEFECGNRVMVVVGSNPEAKGALEWALSHAVQSQDTIVLLHVAKQGGKTNGKIHPRAYHLLHTTKNMCQMKRPEVRVEIAIREGKEKGATIVEAANQLRVSLLVLGQQKQSPLQPLWMIWTRERTRSRVVDYCIQNANCMTLAVRSKNRKYGGYLITTKRHKNFWLLA